eukprot:Em0012g267a
MTKRHRAANHGEERRKRQSVPGRRWDTCFLALLEDDHRVEVVSFPDPHTQQRLDYITATCIANAYQAGDETSVEAPAPGSPLGAFLCPSVAQVRSAPCDALRRGLQLDDAWF